MAAVLAGCAKETEIVSPENAVVTLRASLSGADTKVSADNAGTYCWQKGDLVTVLNTAGDAFEFTTAGSGTSVDFSSASFEGELGTEAMYPASALHTSGHFYLEPEITWVPNASMMPMLGAVNQVSASASFSAVGAVVKIVLYNVADAARKLVVTSDTKKLVGEFTPSEGAIATAESDTYKALTISFAAGHPTNMVFYIPVPTGSLGKLTFTLKDGEDATLFSKETKGAIPAARNQVLVAGGLNCAETVLWSEDFSSFSANDVPTSNGGTVNYACVDGGTTTKVYTSQLASGGAASPELLISKSNGSFTASNIPTDGAASLTLTFMTNQNLTLSSTTEGVTIGSITSVDKARTAVITNSQSSESLSIEFKNTNSSNARLDDIRLIAAGAAATTPSITLADDALTIAIGATSASTDVTYSHPVDEFALVATVNADAKSWLSASLDGNTLIATATGANSSAEARVGTITLRATGVTKSITVTQPSNLLANPTVSVENGNATFTATWSNVENATGYKAYFSSTDNLEADPTAEEELTPTWDEGTSKWSVTKDDLTNGNTYYLYVKTDEVAANYAAPTVYVKKTVQPIGGPAKGTAENPYTASEALAATNELAQNGTIEDVYVYGIISQITTAYNGTYNNVSFNISNDGMTTGDQLLLFRVPANSESDYIVGDAVQFKGTLKNYNGNTPEMVADFTEIYKYKAPSFTPAGGAYTETQSVTLSADAESVIYYTLDGTTPTSTSSVYSAALSISETTTVKAFAIKNGVSTGVVSATYTITSGAAPTEPESIVFADITPALTNQQQYLSPFDGGHFTIQFAGGSNDGKYYTTGYGIRTYGGGTITIASAYNIAEITFAWDGSNAPSDDVADPTGYSTATKKWTGSAKSITLTRPSGSGHWRLKSVTVTYEQ